MKAVKEAIKNWQISYKNDYYTRLDEIESDILSLDVQAESSPLFMEDWLLKQSLRREHYNILLGQKSIAYIVLRFNG